jgi:hypothetical protein
VRYILVCLMMLPIVLSTAPAVAENPPPPAPTETKLNAIIQEFRERLGIAESVESLIANHDELLVSVRRLTGTTEKAFVIQFDRHFLSSLDDHELRAVIAHELGHVWIFTHHPFLQTEALANSKAMEIVSREILIRVYEKVWQRGGKKGRLEDFLARVAQ